MRCDKDLKCLDELIAGLSGADSGTQGEDRYGLLTEHLQAARRDLLGSMPGEYSLSLQQAGQSAGCISGKSDRNDLRNTLRSLIDSEQRTR